MRIGKVLFPVTTLGPGKRLGIWTQGCDRFCKGCSNEELQTFDETKDVSVEKLFDGIKNFPFDGVTISGGEPFLQVKDLKRLIELFLENGYDDILVYTGFTMRELVEKNDEDIDFILSHIAVLIDGPFVENLVDDIPLRGSKNQCVYILNRKFESAYRSVLAEEKKVNIFHFENEVHFIGIPFKGYDKLYKNYIKKVKSDE